MEKHYKTTSLLVEESGCYDKVTGIIDFETTFQFINNFITIDNTKRSQNEKCFNLIATSLENGKEFIVKLLVNASYKRLNQKLLTEIEQRLRLVIGASGKAFFMELYKKVQEITKYEELPYPDVDEVCCKLSMSEFINSITNHNIQRTKKQSK
ncbi:MAG: hypothetical protein GX951_00290 [Mollicutes bacterium]|nr:hypothetical protein [Mollicutes bacterium]